MDKELLPIPKGIKIIVYSTHHNEHGVVNSNDWIDLQSGNCPSISVVFDTFTQAVPRAYLKLPVL